GRGVTMPEVITDNLDLWSSALLTKSTAGRGSNGKQQAYGIKKLRELILELAVRGKLVPQEPNDEPASELLKRTIAEKKRLIKEDVIRQAKEPALADETPDHKLPGSWVWTNLYSIGEIAPRNEEEDVVDSSFVPMQSISEKYGVPVQHEVKTWSEIKSGFTHFREEDVVLAKITPCFQNGKSAVMRGLTNGFGAGTTELHVYRTINACTVPEYVLVYLKSPRFISDGIPKMTGTAGQKRITRDYFAGNHFPLPPLAEQHRIVAKVDELMALCDRLEQQQKHSLEAHQTLVETLLGTLTRVASPQELNEAWTRIASHFDTLFTTEHSIDQLKQAILQLAVMGKLVLQDPNDEPASVLLERIAKRRAELENEGKLKKQPQFPDVANQEMLGDLPTGWELVRFGAITFNRDSERIPLSVEERRGRQGEYDYYGASGVIDSIDDFLFDKPLLLIGEDGANLINRSTPIAFMARGKYWVNNHAHVLDGLTEDLLLYVCLHINAITLEPYVTGTAQPKMNQAKMNSITLALPPIEEQKRIVAKVDELMALCDALKVRLADAQTTQLHLADAIVEQAIC
ncbi:MAG: restriction endonuclease subunit S, partial [Polynucleobacter sp.]|nr:restriction endonuclease subunit S [Polynucleobacter sp.]